MSWLEFIVAKNRRVFKGVKSYFEIGHAFLLDCGKQSVRILLNNFAFIAVARFVQKVLCIFIGIAIGACYIIVVYDDGWERVTDVLKWFLKKK